MSHALVVHANGPYIIKLFYVLVLSIGCSSGVVIEVSIEKGEQLQKLKLSETQITYLLWVEAPPTATPTSLSGFHTKYGTGCDCDACAVIMCVAKYFNIHFRLFW